MRLATLALVLPLATPAAAQEPEPDTTDWHRYLPLEVGNAWQYRVEQVVFPFTYVSYTAAEILDMTCPG
jgi:hypothetical protein